MTTGYPSQDSVRSEVIDLENPDSNCEDYLPYPISSGTYGAVGGLLYGDTPFICGGDTGQGSNCYFLGNSEVQATLAADRYKTAGLVMDEDNIWITGGGDSAVSKTSEYVAPHQESVKGPDLPVSLRQHCMVQLDDDTVMFLGSVYDSERRSPKTLIYSISNNSFTDGPDLTEPKSAMMCGVIEDDQGNKIVVIAGGAGDSKTYYTDEVEFWVVGSGNDIFTKSGHLSSNLCCGTAVTTSDKKSLIVIGGNDSSYRNTLQKVTCTATGCTVETMSQKLKVARYWPVAMLIPDSLANCN